VNDRPLGGDYAVTLWLLAALLLLGGYFFFLRPVLDEADGYAQAAQLSIATAERDEQALADRSRVLSRAQAIRAELHGTVLASSTSASTASFLGDVQRLAHRDGIVLQAMRPDASAPPAPATPPPVAVMPRAVGGAKPGEPPSAAPPEHLDAFEIESHGPFRSVVRFVGDLSHMPTLVRVGSVRLARLQRDGPRIDRDHPLDATIAIQTIRFDRSALH